MPRWHGSVDIVGDHEWRRMPGFSWSGRSSFDGLDATGGTVPSARWPSLSAPALGGVRPLLPEVFETVGAPADPEFRGHDRTLDDVFVADEVLQALLRRKEQLEDDISFLSQILDAQNAQL
eukprot:TRINITY_DN31696_c0_g1_i1.p5 TRINITY_DN31696_c0_g1~~TRINITY_DN31696_c0_g1_i1.p5  ORF type:complete len:121 (-),score=32.38 TRINITY_DN31696_c0_g1_i1:194-556(-)